MADNTQQGGKTQGESAAAKGGAQAAEALRQGAQTMQQSGRATSDTMRHAGEVTAEATQRTGDAASETLRRSAGAFAETQREFLQKTAEQFEEVSHKMAQAARGTSEDMRTFMSLPKAAHGGLQDLHQSVTGLVEGVVRTNLRATQELFQLANPGAFVELQQRFMRDYLDALMQGTATFVRATRRTADETLRPLEQEIEQRQQAHREPSYRHAAE